MAILEIPTTEDKYLIFTLGDIIKAVHSPIGGCTTYNDSWTTEECVDEAAWLARQDELGILPVPEVEEDTSVPE